MSFGLFLVQSYPFCFYLTPFSHRLCFSVNWMKPYLSVVFFVILIYSPSVSLYVLKSGDFVLFCRVWPWLQTKLCLS